MQNIDDLIQRAKELKKGGLTETEIGEELHLGQRTVTWLLTHEVKSTTPPPDVKIGWRSMGVYPGRLEHLSAIISDIILEETIAADKDFETVLGIAINGIPLATLVALTLGKELSIFRPNADGEMDGTLSSNFAGLEGKNVVIVDDVLSTGRTAKVVLNTIKKNNANPLLMVVLVNKTAENNIEGIPLRALLRSRVIA